MILFPPSHPSCLVYLFHVVGALRSTCRLVRSIAPSWPFVYSFPGRVWVNRFWWALVYSGVGWVARNMELMLRCEFVCRCWASKRCARRAVSWVEWLQYFGVRAVAWLVAWMCPGGGCRRGKRGNAHRGPFGLATAVARFRGGGGGRGFAELAAQPERCPTGLYYFGSVSGVICWYGLFHDIYIYIYDLGVGAYVC